MKSKTHLRTFATLAISLFFLTLYACNNNNATSPEPLADVNFNSDQYAVYEYEDEFAGISDATLSTDMTLAQSSPRDFHALQANRGRASFMIRRGHHGMHLWQVLDSLNLTVEQDSLVREQLTQYRECILVPIQEFRDEAAPIIEESRNQRHAVIDSMRAGVLTRQEAFAQLKTLCEEKRAEIQALAEELGLQQAMCDCKLTIY